MRLYSIIPVFLVFVNIYCKHIGQSSIESLHLPITLGVVCGRSFLSNMKQITDFCNYLRFKISSLVGKEGLRYTMATYELQAVGHCFCLLISYCPALRSFSEIVGSNQYVFLSTLRGWEGSTYIHCYHFKRATNRYACLTKRPAEAFVVPSLVHTFHID